jgi:DNA-directed RNA polymerase specialized sigma24 family protein
MPTQPNLVSALRGGDAEAFDELIGPHLETGYRVALAILHNPDEARDALQDAAFKAWRHLGQLRDGRASRPWFLTIVVNQSRSIRRDGGGRWSDCRASVARVVTSRPPPLRVPTFSGDWPACPRRIACLWFRERPNLPVR